VEAAIRQTLAAARPRDAVLGEEEGQRGHTSRRWIIDPIDGAAGFADGDDRCSVLLALEVDGQVVAAVAAVPAEPAALPQDNWLFAELAALTTPLPWTAHPALLVAAGELDLAVHPHTGPALYSASHCLHQAALEHLGKSHSEIDRALEDWAPTHDRSRARIHRATDSTRNVYYESYSAHISVRGLAVRRA